MFSRRPATCEISAAVMIIILYLTSQRVVKRLHKVHGILLELRSHRHTTKSHQFFGGRHLTIAVHTGDREHAVLFYVERKELARSYITLVDDLVPCDCVAHVKQPGVELACPKERHTVIRNLLPQHIHGSYPALLHCRPPVLDALAVARERMRKISNVSGCVYAVGSSQVFVNKDAAILMQINPFKKTCRWFHPNPDDHEISL